MSNTETTNNSSESTMIIHLTDRTPIKINIEDWSIESNGITRICESMSARLEVISNLYDKHIVYGGVHNYETKEVIFEGGYILEREECLPKKIVSVLNSLVCDIGHHAVMGVDDDVVAKKMLDKLEQLNQAVKRRMPPEPLIVSGNMQLKRIYETEGKIAAIKKHRETTGDGLKEAVEYINKISQEEGWVLLRWYEQQ